MLSVERLVVRRGGRVVISDVSLDLDEGHSLAVLGPNGSGKSTLMETIAGFVDPAAGHIRLDGREVTRAPAFERARLGLKLIGQGGRAVPELTVTENLSLAAEGAGLKAFPVNLMELFPRLEQRRRVRAGSLSGGEQQMLTLVMGLAGKARVVLLDEPSFGLAPTAVDDLFKALARLRELGYTFLIAEQQVNRALKLVDRLIVLRSGRVVQSAAAPKTSNRAAMRRLVEGYLGAAPAADGRRHSQAEVSELVRLNITVEEKRELQLRARSQGVSPSELVSDAVRRMVKR